MALPSCKEISGARQRRAEGGVGLRLTEPQPHILIGEDEFIRKSVKITLTVYGGFF